jgi:hypothetical protein
MRANKKGEPTPEIDLSSAWTFSAKFVFPVLWISGFGSGTVLLWVGDLHDKNHVLPSAELKFVFVGAWIVGSTFILWANASLKRVGINGQNLFVSNYFREILIPLNTVTDVKQNRWLNSRPITIHLGDATEFGDRLTFIPKRRIRFLFWRVDPLVQKLKQFAGLAPDV